MDTLKAAILNVKLQHIEQWNERRIQHAIHYRSALAHMEQLHLPEVREHVKHTFHLYVIRTAHRNALKAYLGEEGIQTAIHYPRALPNLPAYRYMNNKPSDFPVASKYQNEVLSIPVYPEMTEDMIRYVAEKIRAFFEQGNR